MLPCYHKMTYPTRRYALMVAARRRTVEPRTPPLEAYKCRSCRGWHLTKARLPMESARYAGEPPKYRHDVNETT